MTGSRRAGVAGGDEIRRWLDGVRDRTEGVWILAGGDNGSPLARRPVVGEVHGPAGLAELRTLATTGEFLDGICRCFGSLTLALLDAGAEIIGSEACTASPTSPGSEAASATISRWPTRNDWPRSWSGRGTYRR
ncbi:hypothetical protein [Streptomyces sp. NPDC051636]|uniref:hypothetical protein n=1 Tax=Streptomyces sp. NPDC051636 TaxID=3365663 RepID=UPI0037BB8A9D